MPTLNDAAYGMEEAGRQVLDYILSQKKHLRRYFVLIYVRPHDTEQIISKVVILHTRPPKLLGTVCYEINNQWGTQRRLWVLPLDYDIDPRLLDVDKTVPQPILESAQGMLIVN